jgi:hypothetical protein
MSSANLDAEKRRMSPAPPSEQIEAWIAGSLAPGAGQMIEKRLEKHPEALEKVELERGILQEAARWECDHLEFAAFIATI